jgi:hypothetical protein
MKIPEDPEILWRAMQIAVVKTKKPDLRPQRTVNQNCPKTGEWLSAPLPEAIREARAKEADARMKNIQRFEDELRENTLAVLRAFQKLREGGQL